MSHKTPQNQPTNQTEIVFHINNFQYCRNIQYSIYFH